MLSKNILFLLAEMKMLKCLKKMDTWRIYGWALFYLLGMIKLKWLKCTNETGRVLWKTGEIFSDLERIPYPGAISLLEHKYRVTQRDQLTSWLIPSVLYFCFFLLYPFNPLLPRMGSPWFLQPWQWAPTSLAHSFFSALRNKWPSDEGQLSFVRKQWHSWPPNCRSPCLMSMWVGGSTLYQSWSTVLEDPSIYLKSSEHQAWSSQLLCMH